MAGEHRYRKMTLLLLCLWNLLSNFEGVYECICVVSKKGRFTKGEMGLKGGKT